MRNRRPKPKPSVFALLDGAKVLAALGVGQGNVNSHLAAEAFFSSHSSFILRQRAYCSALAGTGVFLSLQPEVHPGDVAVVDGKAVHG
jgi:hypothetical protein